jgi:hypothetical protein
MERLNWAVVGLMGLVTALGLTTSSGGGKAQTELVDSEVEVIACAPLTSTAPTSDAATIELAVNVPAATHAHAGCSACAAKNAGGHEPAGSKAFDELVALIQSSVKPSTGVHVHAGDCPGNCQETGVCCDKSLPKSGAAVATKTETPPCEGECLLGKKQEVVANLDQALAPRSGVLVETQSSTAPCIDCPLAKATAALTNLTKNFVCEGGDCLAAKDHGTLTIKAVDPAVSPVLTTNPEGLLNLVAAAEVAAANAEPIKTEPGTATSASTITITNDGLTKAGSGTLTLSIKAADVQPAAAATTLAEQFQAAEAKPAIDNSRAAARAAKLAKLEAKLSQASFLKSEETKLADIAELIESKLEMPVILDRKALEEAAFDTAIPFYIGAHPEMELGDHLLGILKDVSLTWLIPASNDRVLITTTTAAESTHLNRVYEVSDLVGNGFSDAEEMIERIESLVAPMTWASRGGRGDISVWQKDSRAALMVSNTFATHRELTDLLEDLRLVSASKEKAAAKQISDKQEPLLKRYTLQVFDPSISFEDRAKIRKTQSETFAALFKEIPEFDPAALQVIELDHQSILVTKQSPKVHAQIVEYFKILEWDPRKHGGLTGANF